MFRNFVTKTVGACGYLIQYGCIAHCVLDYGADIMITTGPSMEPTFHERDVVLTEHISVIRKTIEKGDVVIVRSPTNPHKLICKRVIAMEGDKVWCSFWYQKVPRDHVWLEGDNKDNSTDSRDYGPVPYGLLRSRVCYKIWPLEDIGTIKLPGES